MILCLMVSVKSKDKFYILNEDWIYSEGRLKEVMLLVQKACYYDKKVKAKILSLILLFFQL